MRSHLLSIHFPLMVMKFPLLLFWVLVPILMDCCLLRAIFYMHRANYLMQRGKLKKELVTSEKQAVTALKSRFTDIEGKALPPIIESAEEELAKEESRWFAFSSTSRASMLTILLELKTRIDKEALGF